MSSAAQIVPEALTESAAAAAAFIAASAYLRESAGLLRKVGMSEYAAALEAAASDVGDLVPDDAAAALERVKRHAKAAGMREAAKIAGRWAGGFAVANAIQARAVELEADHG